MIDSIQNILVQVSDFLWSYIIITILICCAVFFYLAYPFRAVSSHPRDGQAPAASR